ncbi:hypothetical protein C1T20_02235 [Paenibacillus polymyxa]|nr:hypothetical protein C1T20_02235 [Paenibacillus polymyxa]
MIGWLLDRLYIFVLKDSPEVARLLRGYFCMVKRMEDWKNNNHIFKLLNYNVFLLCMFTYKVIDLHFATCDIISLVRERIIAVK